MEEPIPLPPQHQQIVEAVRQAMAERALPQGDVARQIDMSASALSSFLAGRYKGDNAEMSRKLSAWLAALPAGDGLAGIIARMRAYVATPTALAIRSQAEFAKMVGAVVTVATVPGIGKSITLKSFAEASPAVWYCEFSKDTASVYAVLTEVAEVVGIVEKPQRPDELRRDIVRRIERRQGLLICDEAQHLRPDGFEAIRTLYDRSGVGVLFAGHSDLADKIARLPQLDGRVSAPMRIARAKAADVDALLDAWGSDCRRTREFLRRHVGQAAGLRRIARVHEMAAIDAFGEGVSLSFDHVSRAWASLAGSVRTE